MNTNNKESKETTDSPGNSNTPNNPLTHSANHPIRTPNHTSTGSWIVKLLQYLRLGNKSFWFVFSVAVLLVSFWIYQIKPVELAIPVNTDKPTEDSPAIGNAVTEDYEKLRVQHELAKNVLKSWNITFTNTDNLTVNTEIVRRDIDIALSANLKFENLQLKPQYAAIYFHTIAKLYVVKADVYRDLDSVVKALDYIREAYRVLEGKYAELSADDLAFFNKKNFRYKYLRTEMNASAFGYVISGKELYKDRAREILFKPFDGCAWLDKQTTMHLDIYAGTGCKPPFVIQ